MAVNFSGSLVATGSIISTTGFTGSLYGTASNAATASSADNFLVRGTLTAQTINVQTITSSVDFVTGSSVNGSLLTNTHQFTGSVGVTGSLAINGVDYNSTSASFDTRITNTSSSLATLTTNNAIASASFDTRVNANSSSIVQLSGSYLTDSASFSTRVTNNSASIAAVSSSYVASSASFETKINTISSSYATTGSNKFVGGQTITGSLLVSGSTTQIGNNTLTGNTSLTGSINISGSTTQVGNNTLLGNTTLSGSIIISGSVGAKADINLGGVLRLDPATDPGTSNLTASFLFTSASNTTTGFDLYYRQSDNIVKFKWIEGGISTGLLYGGVITYSGSTIFVSKGSGIINNLNASTGSEIAPNFKYITWNDFTGSATYLTSSQNTFIYVDDTGIVRQQPAYFNPDQFREALPLGRVTHANYTSITGAGSNVQTTYDGDAQQNEFIRIFGPIKESGLLLSAQTGSMCLSIGAGQAYNLGGFYPQDPNHPSHYVSNGFATASIARAYRSGSAIRLDNNNGAFYTTVDSTKWDDGTGVLNSMSSGDFQIQRVFVNPVTGRTVVYYGQAVYSTLLNALQYLPTDPFEEGEFTAKSLVFVGYLVIKGNTTDLTDTGNNSIIQSGIFRGTQGSSGGAIVSTTLDSLSDVVISTPSNGQALIYNSGIWVNSNPVSSSYAATASFVNGISNGTASFANTSSFANTASYAVTASYVLGQSPTASHALTASSADNFLVRGTLTAQTINAQTVSSSIVYSSGSNIFGDATNDNHRFTGSVLISGSLITSTPITGSSITGSFTGSLSGIASQASTLLVTTSSTSQDYSLAFAPSGADGYVQFYTDGGKDVLYNPSTNILQARNIVALNSISGSLTGSLTGTASYATQAITASFVTTAQTASYVVTAQTASYILNAISASRAVSASRADSAATASYILNAVSASFASTASSINQLNQNVIITGSLAVGSLFPSSASTENTLTIGLPPAGGTGEGGQILFQASGGLYTSASMLDNWQNQFRILRGTNASSDGLVVSWNMHTKQMQLPAYNNASSFTGTAVANLAVNSNGDVITVSTTGASVFPYTGNAVITGSLTTTGIIYATPNGGMYFQGGDDAALYDINVSNHMGIYGVQDSTIGSIKLGSGGGIISGRSGSIGIGTTTPTNTLQVVGGVTATSFTGSLSGNASTATSSSYAATSSYVQNAQSASYVQTAQTASYVQNAQSASYIATAQTASYVATAQTASYVLNAVSSSFATLAQTATTASFIQTAQTASYVLNAVSSSFAATSSFSNNFRATALSLGSTPINITTGYGNYVSSVGYSVTGSVDTADFWIRVINISDQPQRIKLFVDASADNTIARDEFEIVTSGYGMNNHILRKPTSFYNTSKIIGILTTNPTAASQEVWVNIAAVSTSGTVSFYSNVSLDSLANMQTSKTTTKPTKSASGSELTINSTKRQKYTLQLSAGAEFNGEVNVSGSSIFSGSVVSTLGFTGSLLGTSSYATQALTASNANTASYVLNAVSASFAATTSFANNLTVAGTLTAQTINVQTITSSIEFNTGSTRNGSLLTNTHEFTGSVGITGSLDVKGNQRVTGSLNILSGSVRIDANDPTFIIAASSNNRSFELRPANSSIDGTNSTLSFNRFSTTDVVIASGSGNGGRVGIRKTPTVPLDISGSTLITGSLTVTEGITGSLQGTATTASFAATSSYSNDFTIGGTLTFDGTLTDYNTVASSIVGTNNLFTKATGSYTSAFIKYTVTSGSNARSGEVMTVWNGTSTQYVDNSTLDIGDTSPVVISTSIVTSQIQINAATSTSGWKVKAIGTFI